VVKRYCPQVKMEKKPADFGLKRAKEEDVADLLNHTRPKGFFLGPRGFPTFLSREAFFGHALFRHL
jgi:hypothetical protein